MMQMLNELVIAINTMVWGWPMIIFLFGTHIYLTIRTGIIQRWTITKGLKLIFVKDDDAEGEVSHLQALMTALAATIGTGNIVGVGTAIVLGGPGAVFWCWISGVLGIATKYAESLIAIKYRVKTADGRLHGGAMYALERGLNMKWMGTIFAVLALFTSFGTGCAAQVASIVEVCKVTFEIPVYTIGIIVAVMVAIVIWGGLKMISQICMNLVPFMSILYMVGCVLILGMNFEYIIPAIVAICQLAIQPEAISGGLVGTGIMMAIRFGVARGLFSNESGMGSSPIVAAAAKTKNPVRHALVASTGTFWDTVVICLMTGLVFVTTLLKYPEINIETVTNGGQLAVLAFEKLPVLGPTILTVSIIVFAYATILGWAYYGETCLEYVAHKKWLVVYRIVFVIIAVTAPIFALDFLWLVADTLNALMVIPNLIAVLMLSNVIVDETKKYIHNLDAKDEKKIPYVERWF